jgi:translation initiation factor 2 alpha subunit (eIF-2alpha)
LSDALSENLQALNASKEELDEFNLTMDEKIAKLTGKTAEFLARRFGEVSKEMQEAADSSEVLAAAQELMGLVIEQNALDIEAATTRIQGEFAPALAELADEIEAEEQAIKDAESALKDLNEQFSEFTASINELAGAEANLASIRDAETDFALELQSVRFRIGNRFEESNPEEQFAKILTEFGSSLGGKSALQGIVESGVGDPRQIQEMQALLSEAFGTVTQAHNQTLISDQEALERLGVLEELQGLIFDAQEAIESANINRIIDEIAGTDFAEDSGLAEFIKEQRELGITPSMEEINALGSAFASDRQLELQTNIDDSNTVIAGKQEDIRLLNEAMALDLKEMNEFFKEQLVIQLTAIKDLANLEAQERINLAQTNFMLAFNTSIEFLRGWNPALATSFEAWLTEQGGPIPTQPGSRE